MKETKDQLLQWVFVGIAGAFAIAGGVLLYKGYLTSEGTQSASNHGLRIVPDRDGVIRRNHCGIRVLTTGGPGVKWVFPGVRIFRFCPPPRLG